MKKIILLFFIVSLTDVFYAQVITVRDEESNAPLELVTITSKNPKAFTVTNSSGEANIDLFNGAENITFQMLGYKTLNTSYKEIISANSDIYMELTNISLDQVVVSATRWNQAKRDVPSKVATILPKDIQLQNPQTAADLLGMSGEVMIQKSQQGGGSPMIRGFATNRLLIAVDGVRMNTAIFRSGNLQNVISLDPFVMERTEVLFGPGSIIYGSDAIGGVMSFYTLNPQLSLSDNVFIKGNAVVRSATANNEYTGHFDVNLGWKKWAFTTSISYNDYGDLIMGSNGPDEYLRPEYVQRINNTDQVVANDDPKVQHPTAYQQVNIMQKVRFVPNDNWDLVYGFHYSTTSDYDRYDRLIRYKKGLPRSGQWYYGPQKWMMHNLNISNHNVTDFYDEVTLRLAYQEFEESRIDRDFNGNMLYNRVEKVDAYSLNLDLSKTLSEKHTLLYGVEAVYNDVESTGTDEDIAAKSIVTGPSRYPQSSWTSLAAYLNYQFRVSEKLMLQAGVRYNYFDLEAEFDTTFYPFPFTEADVSNSAVTGSIGLVYNPDETWQIGLNLSTGFRSPNVDDLGKVFDSEPGAVVVPNPGLKAEYAYNAELGIAKIFDDVMKIDASVYYTHLDNALVRRDFTLNGSDSLMYDGEMSRVQAIQNAASAYVWGIQTGIEIKIVSGLNLSTRFNYQKGEEELDDGSDSPLRHVGPYFGSTHLTYTAQKLNLDLYTVYNGEVSYDDLATSEQGKDYMYAIDENGNPYSPSWYTINFKAMYKLTDIISVTAGIENVTDQRYRPYSSGIAAAGRNFIFSIKAGW